MTKILLAVFLLSGLISSAQKSGNPKNFATSINADDLKKHLYIVAGKEMEGRETATEGQRKAAAYIEEYFKSLKLLPGSEGSYQMKFPLFQDSLINASVAVNGKKFELFKDFAMNLNESSGSQIMSS